MLRETVPPQPFQSSWVWAIAEMATPASQLGTAGGHIRLEMEHRSSQPGSSSWPTSSVGYVGQPSAGQFPDVERGPSRQS